MASKHHRSKRGRSLSRYKERLAARGLTKSPTMPTLDALRMKQSKRGYFDLLSDVDELAS